MSSDRSPLDKLAARSGYAASPDIAAKRKQFRQQRLAPTVHAEASRRILAAVQNDPMTRFLLAHRLIDPAQLAQGPER